MEIINAPILARKKVAQDATEVHFGLGRPFAFRPGQYVRITIPTLLKPDEKGDYRDFSIASSPNNKKELIIITRESKSGFKESLLGLPEGTKLKLTGPFGTLGLPQDESPIVFVAWGIGITPFLSMIRYLVEKKDTKRRITLLYANRNAESAVYLDELEGLQKHYPFFKIKDTIGSFDRTFIKEQASEREGSHWFIAGPPKMAVEMLSDLVALDIPKQRIHTEEFLGYEPGASFRGRVKETIRRPGEDSGSIPATRESVKALLDALDQTALVSKTDAEGTIVYVNKKFLEISQYTTDELVGQNHRILKSGYHSVDFYKDLWDTISAGKIWRGEIKDRAKDGTFYWVDSSIAPILGDTGSPQYYISVRFPITARKEAEERNVRSAIELEASNQELEAFNYSVSHDLRAPLRAIDGFAGILAEDFAPKLDDEGKRLIGTIRGSAQQMSTLIDDLLNFAHLNTQDIKGDRVNMTEMVKSIVEDFQAANPGRTVRFSVEKLPDAYGDSSMLRQVWLNLLSNAMKFTGRKKVGIIAVGGSTAERDQATFYVKDNGAGFDMKYSKKLFGVFQRLHDAEEFEGTGLGLAIVKRIITRHHGTVSAEGKVNEGATFTFTLPVPPPSDS